MSIMIERTLCAKCKTSPAAVLLKAKLYCGKCALIVQYSLYYYREPIRRKL